MVSRVLIVGFGSIGQRHLRLARESIPEADIRVLRHQSFSSVPPGSNGCFSSIQDAIEFAPQLAVIANPSPFHIFYAQALADVGIHLLIEKPLSNSTIGVERLIDTCHRKGTILLIGYNLRYLTSLQRFRDLLAAGIIGKILSVRCEVGQYLPSWRPENDYRLGVTARHELGGGALLELSHELDYIRWIFGEVERVSATVSRQSSLTIDVEDSAHLTLTFMPTTGGHRLIGTVNLDLIRHDATRLCIAIGENGSLRWNGITGEVTLYLAGEKEWNEVFCDQHQRDVSYLAEWKHFISCVIENIKPLVTGEDGLHVLQIIEAARKSVETNRHVIVER